MKNFKSTIIEIFVVTLLISMLFTISACGNGPADSSTTEQQGLLDAADQNHIKSDPNSLDNQDIEAIDEFELLRQSAADYVRGPLKLLSTEEVYQNIVVAKDTNYQLISTRYEEDYLKGHIEGASWIVRTEFAYDDTLDKLDKDKKIVLYCYTASGATYVSAMLNLMGYEAYGMAIGMTEWTDNRAVAATERMPIALEDYPIETAINALPKENELPVINTGMTEVAEIVFEMGSQYFSSGQPRWIGAETIKEAYDNNVLSQYQIIDVRDRELYEKGHVPTAANIPYEQTMDLEYLQKLSKNKPIIVISEDGQSATQIAALYNFLGYDARTMLYGMMTWTTDAKVIGKPLWDGPKNYPWIGTVTP